MSNSLQLALAATGGVILLGLMAHNAWSAHKSRPRKADPVAPQPASSQLPESNTPDTNAPANAAESDASDTSATPAACALSGIAAQGLACSSVNHTKPLDPLIDAIAPIKLDAQAQVSGDAAIAALPASRRVGDKPFAIEGRNASHWQRTQFSPERVEARRAAIQSRGRQQ